MASVHNGRGAILNLDIVTTKHGEKRACDRELGSLGLRNVLERLCDRHMQLSRLVAGDILVMGQQIGGRTANGRVAGRRVGLAGLARKGFRCVVDLALWRSPIANDSKVAKFA